MQTWHLLVWAGQRPQTPVVMAAKPGHFAELDVVATVRNLARECPRFWTSQQFVQPLKDIVNVAPDWFCRVWLKQQLAGCSEPFGVEAHSAH